MTRSATRVLVAAIVVVMVLLSRTDTALVCGPEFEEAVFVHTAHPDLPAAPYAAGNLGVLQRTFARSYLAVAFRFLSDRPLAAIEQRGAVALWNQRLGGEAAAMLAAEDAMDAWLRQRRSIAGVPGMERINVFRRVAPGSFLDYVNCLPPAFVTARVTLDRLMADPRSRASAADWVRAQDRVFANCDVAAERLEPLATDAPADARADRAYQIAAAHFYGQRFDAAIADFERMAIDQSSPWRTMAPYLVARAWIRKGTLTTAEGQVDRPALERAAAQLRGVLKDPAQAAWHASARGLLGFVRFRLEPEARLHELAALIAGGSEAESFTQMLGDYTLLFDRLMGESAPPQLAGVPAALRTDGMTDWIATFQSTDPAALTHAVDRWRATRAAAWLVAAISKVPASHAAARELQDAARLTTPDAPGYPTIAYHALRLAIEAGAFAEARAQLDAVLARHRGAWPRSTVNQFLALRTRVAASFEEFLTFAPRQATTSTLYADLPGGGIDASSRLAGREREPLFDADGALVLNERLTLAQLADAAARTALPARLRQSLATSAWTRAVMLGDHNTARQVTPILEALASELREDLKTYVSAADATARELAAIAVLLRSPGLQPTVDAGFERETPVRRLDMYRRNWWCAFNAASSLPAPPFVTPATAAAAARDRGQLAARGAAPTYLAREAVRIAQLAPSDPRAPEILHLAVRATRYGCTDDATGPASKAAFDLLHKRYPASQWARNTPYWYK